MSLGPVLPVMLWVALFITIGAIAAYIIAAVSRSREIASLGRTAYIASTAAVVFMSAAFMWLILKNQFELDYIYRNSSRDLPLLYKVSVFWAGQQGSFLFWAFCAGIIGTVVMLKAREFEPWLMAFWSAGQALFLALLLIDSPFKLIQAEMMTQITDGRGLRELLQNPWMAIHPPLLFIGYAAICVPAAFAFSALANADFRTWCRTTLPWAIFGWITLGAGIIIGGYWAYEVLGWGGYWAWDPVENASLVPWLTGTALLHGMLAERYRGSFRRVNVVLALMTFLFVFYATFLTRSNVLEDLSVHTFGDPRMGAPLIWFMGVFILFMAVLSIWRWRKMESGPSYTAALSKDFLLFLSVIFFSASALFVLLGTSAPIIGSLASHIPVLQHIIPKQVAVKASFYNMTNGPIALVVMSLMALAPILAWRKAQAEGTRMAVTAMVAFSAVLIAAVAAVVFDLPMIAILIACAALAALATNAWTLYRTSKFGLRLLGGFAAHVGMGLMLLGIVLSAAGGKPKTLSLFEHAKPQPFKGYSLSFQGHKPVTKSKESLLIRVQRGGRVSVAKPTMQLTKDNEMLASPYILTSFARDLYIAPKAIVGPEQKELRRGGQPTDIQDFQLSLLGFVLPEGHVSRFAGIGARIEAIVNGKKEEIIPLMKSAPAPKSGKNATAVPGTDASIVITKIKADEHAVSIDFHPNKRDTMQLDLTKGQAATVGGYTLTFKQFFFPSGAHQETMLVGAEIDVTGGGITQTVKPVFTPTGADAGPRVISQPIAIPGANAMVSLNSVDVNSATAVVTVTPTVGGAVVDVSVKPFISLLWIGAIIALLGGCVAMWRRTVEAGRESLTQ